MFRLLLGGTFGIVLALALACAALAWWGASVAGFGLERTRLAHEVLTQHLRLKVTVEGLLREAALAAIPGSNVAFDPVESRQRLRADFARLRSGIVAEIALLPRDATERAELDAVAALELEADAVLHELEHAAEFFAAGDHAAGRGLLRDAVLARFGPRFQGAVNAAVEAERAEVMQTEREAAAALELVSRLSHIAALLAVAVAAGAVLVLRRRLQRPLAELAAVAEAATAGDLSRRIPFAPIRGGFGRVVRSFNAMLDEVARSRATLEQHRLALEQAVAERTGELAAANTVLRRGDEARRRFLADVSHELRTPLTVMRGEAEIALRGGDKPPADYRQALARVAEEAAHTARLVDDLLFVARSEAGEARTALQPVAFDEVLHRAVAAARTLAEARGVRISEAIGGQRLVVRGDPDRLRQLALILLDNAVRYSDPGGAVTVSLAETPEGARLAVSDTGMGIAPEDLARVFERFYRGEGAVSRHADGSGLGLPLARAIARAHGGEATLDSRLGQGTTVTVVLPAARPLQAAA